MRKINFLLAMAFLVFIFSGCGGSASSDSTSSSSDSSSTLHSKIIDTLTGTWIFDESSGFTGKGTIDGTSTAITLSRVTQFQMSFSEIEFANTSEDSAGNAEVFYSFTSSAWDSSYNSLGNFILRSYSSSTDTTKTRSMVLQRVTDNQWTIKSSGLTIIVSFDSDSNSKIHLQITGTGYLSSVAHSCTYTIECSLIKTSSTPSTGGSTDEETTSEDTSTILTSADMAKVLTGTWLLNSEGDSTATNTSTGEALTLDISTGTKISFSDISLEAASSKVFYSNNWYALNSSGISAGLFSIKSYSDSSASDKTQAMTFINVSDDEWKFQTNTGLTINITVVSETEISTKWEGYSYISSLGGYYRYEIECTFRKTSDTPSDTDDVIISDDVEVEDSSLADILKGTWLLHTEGDATATNVTTGNALTLSTSAGTKISFSDDITFSTNETASANVFYLLNWQALGSDGTFTGNFTLSSDTGNTTQTMNLINVSGDEWRLESTSSSLYVNVKIVSDTEISTTWKGITFIPSLSGYYNFSIECSFRKSSDEPTYDTTPIENNIPVNSDETVLNTAQEILEGTWKFINHTSASATSTTEGQTKVLELILPTDIELTLSNMTVTADNTTSKTGTITVYSQQKWTARDSSLVHQSGYFTFGKNNETMKFAQVGDAVWLIEDVNNADENITITINSNEEISTVWKGLATTLDDGDTYYYEISASFRKQ